MKKKLTPIEKKYLEADRLMQAENTKQVCIIVPLSAYILWKRYGWGELRILRRLEEVEKSWHECAEHEPEKSMLQMLEDETGVELALDGKKSYHEYAFLDNKAWKNPKGLDLFQLTQVRLAQRKWSAMLILASVCVALHRKDGYGYGRIARFVDISNHMRKQYGEEPETYMKLLEGESQHLAGDLKRRGFEYVRKGIS